MKTMKGEEIMTERIKKILALALCLVMVLSLAACGGSGDEPTATPTPNTSAEGGILTDDEAIYMNSMGEF